MLCATSQARVCIPPRAKHPGLRDCAVRIVQCFKLIQWSQPIVISLQDYDLTTKGFPTYHGKRFAGQGVSVN